MRADAVPWKKKIRIAFMPMNCSGASKRRAARVRSGGGAFGDAVSTRA